MRFKELFFKECLYDMNGFNENKEYIFLGDDENNENNGIYISETNEKQICSNISFRLSSAMKPIKDMVCIYEGANKTLTPFNVYSIFRYEETPKDSLYKRRYLIVDDFYKFTKYPADYFITIEEFEKLKELPNFEEVIKAKVDKLKEKNKIVEEMPFKMELIEQIYELSESTDLTVHNDIIDDTQNKQLKRAKKNISIVIDMIFITSLIINITPKTVSTVLNILISILSILAYLKIKDIKVYENDTTEDLSDSIRACNSLEQVNKLPVEVLAKIKIIENNIQILNRLNISNDILKLVKDSVDFTTLLIQYESNDTTAKKLEEFLDNTIEYIKTLKENKNIEEEYIKKELAENINVLIDKNSIIFKSMVEDNKYLIDHFK